MVCKIFYRALSGAGIEKGVVIVATNIEKAAELLKDQDFIVKVSKCADQNAAIALFKENGADVTAEDLAKFGTLFAALRDNDGELPDEVAEQVAGGAFDMKNLGALLGAVGDFIKAMATPIDALIKIFSGETPTPSGGSGSGGTTK